MITTIPADLIILFIVGMIFSLGTLRNINSTRTVLANKYFLAALLYNTLFCLPIGVYCYVVFPDWCWMYWLDSRDAALGLVITAFVGYYISFTCGFAGAILFERRRRLLGVRVLLAAAAVLLIFAVINYKRLFFVGSLEQFQAGALPVIFRRRLLAVIVFAGMPLALAALIGVLSYFGTELDHRVSPEEMEAARARKCKVSITRIQNREVKEAIRKSLAEWNGLDYLGQLLDETRPVLLKPNLAGGGKDRPGSQTSPELIEAVVDLIRELKPEARIMIGESGSIVWWDLRTLLNDSRYERLFREKGVEFINLSRTPKVLHDFGGRMGRELVPELLHQDPIIIDLPLAKTHTFYRMSGALKNMFGILPLPLKLARYHTKGFADWQGRIFLDIYRNFPPHLVIIDGSVAGEGYCPVAGKAKPSGFIISADDALAADLALARIMGFAQQAVPYLAVAQQQGLVPEYAWLGEDPESVAPSAWKKPRLRFSGLVLNFFAIILEHVKAPRHG